MTGLNIKTLKRKVIQNKKFCGNYFYYVQWKDDVVLAIVKKILDNFDEVCKHLEVSNLTYTQAVSRINIYCDNEIHRAMTNYSP